MPIQRLPKDGRPGKHHFNQITREGKTLPTGKDIPEMVKEKQKGYKADDIVIAQDTREHLPYDFSMYGIRVEKIGLPYGDYTLLYPDLREILIVERKNIDDFVNCCGNDRKRFEKELLALRGYKYAYVVGEFSLQQVMGMCYKSQTHPHSVLGSIAKWQHWGIKFAFLETRVIAAYFVSSLFRNIASAETNLARSHCNHFDEFLPVPEICVK